MDLAVTTLPSSAENFAETMKTVCSKDHPHAWLEGSSKCARSAYYPKPMAKKVIKKFKADFDKEVSMPEVVKELNVVGKVGLGM